MTKLKNNPSNWQEESIFDTNSMGQKYDYDIFLCWSRAIDGWEKRVLEKKHWKKRFVFSSIINFHFFYEHAQFRFIFLILPFYHLMTLVHLPQTLFLSEIDEYEWIGGELISFINCLHVLRHSRWTIRSLIKKAISCRKHYIMLSTLN